MPHPFLGKLSIRDCAHALHQKEVGSQTDDSAGLRRFDVREGKGHVARSFVDIFGLSCSLASEQTSRPRIHFFIIYRYLDSSICLI